jgi:hypothetical protein
MDKAIDFSYSCPILKYLVVDIPLFYYINWLHSPIPVPNMYQNGNKARNEAIIKFVAPIDLKVSLLELAKERNIALSSLLRLIASDYVKRNKQA